MVPTHPNLSADVDFDVAVVGAGPSGCAAALRCAEQGLNVVHIERGSAPGSKNLSGGVLYSRVLSDAVPSFASEAPYERVVTRNVTTFLNETSSVSIDYDDDRLREEVNAVTVLRAHLDPWLAGKAEEAGAFLMPGMHVDSLVTEEGPTGRPRVVGLSAGGDVLRSHVVIAADGVNSFLAQGAGLRPRPSSHQLAVGIKAVVNLPAERIEDRFGVRAGEGAAHALVGDASAGVAGGGFLYTNKESLSLGLVLRLDDLVRSGHSSHALFERFLAHPGLARYLEGGEVIEYGSHLVAEGGLAMVGDLVADGLLIAGDAGGFTINSGLQLRGMDLAIGSGLAAGDAAATALATGDVSSAGLKAYTDLLEDSFVMADMRTYAGAPSFFERSGPYQHWGATLAEVMHTSFSLDGTPRKAIRDVVRGAVRSSGVPLRQWAGDAWAAVRSL